MSESSGTRSSLLALAKRGDPNAIAYLLNHSFRTKGIVTRVVWHENCLEIWLESNTIPDQTLIMTLIRRGFDSLNPESIRLVNVYAQITGNPQLVWQEELQLKPADIDTSLLNWLNQGDVSTVSSDFSLSPFAYAFTPSEATRFLRFQLTAEDTALLPLISIKEVLKLSVDEILPVPDMPAPILGLYNFRGEMLWLVDLLSQLTPPELALQQSEQPHLSYASEGTALLGVTAIAIQTDTDPIGMVVPQIFDIEIYDLQELQSIPAHFPSPLATLMQGYFPQCGIPVLDAHAVLRHLQLQTLTR
jgi:positive phototaxis protein PixI